MTKRFSVRCGDTIKGQLRLVKNKNMGYYNVYKDSERNTVSQLVAQAHKKKGFKPIIDLTSGFHTIMDTNYMVKPISVDSLLLLKKTSYYGNTFVLQGRHMNTIKRSKFFDMASKIGRGAIIYLKETSKTGNAMLDIDVVDEYLKVAPEDV